MKLNKVEELEDEIPLPKFKAGDTVINIMTKRSLYGESSDMTIVRVNREPMKVISVDYELGRGGEPSYNLKHGLFRDSYWYNEGCLKLYKEGEIT